VYVADYVYAHGIEESQYYYNFNFDIPPHSTIDGIEVGIRIYGPETDNMSCALMWDYDATSHPGDGERTDHKRIAFDTSLAWHYYGGPNDTWGRTWDASEFSNANFGTRFGGRLSYVDAVKAKVYYTTPVTCRWPMFRYNPQHAGRSNYATGCGGALLWTYTTAGDVMSSPAQALDGTVYVGSEDNVFYALLSTGDLEWSYVSGDDIPTSPALDAAGNVYVGSEDNKFYAFDSSGGLNWSYAHPGGGVEDKCKSSPVIDPAGAIYMQVRSGLCVFAAGGVLNWSFGTDTAGSAHPSSPAIGTDGRIFWGGGDLSVLYAVNSDRSLAWSYAMAGELQSSPSIDAAGQVYVGSYDNNLYAFISAGAFSWSYLTGADVYSSPAIDTSGSVYVGSRDNRFYVFTSVGALSWSYDVGENIDSSPAIDARDWVYVGAQDNRVYAFESSGALVWMYATGELVDSSPSLGSDGRLFVGSNDNNVYSIGPGSITYTLYGDATGEENWIALPFTGTGIETTEDLGNSIGASFSAEEGDTIFIESLDASEQQVITTTGVYTDGSWSWDPWGGYATLVGAMYKVLIYRTEGGGFEWTISGNVPPAGTVQFTLYNLSGDYDNDNWISVPFERGDLTKLATLGESITAAIEYPEEGDEFTIVLMDVGYISGEVTIVNSYTNGVWNWEDDYDVWPGMPFMARPYRAGGMPTITWP
jgi:hypothetical protein